MTRNYTIGYGKPPASARFQKGKSGNPKGRPKGAQNLKTIVARELKKKVRVREGDRDVELSKLEAWVVTTLNRALKEGGRDSELLRRLIAEVELTQQITPSTPLAPEEENVLAAYEERLRGQWEQEASTEQKTPPAEPRSVDSAGDS